MINAKNMRCFLSVLFFMISAFSEPLLAQTNHHAAKLRILVVSSYHSEYLWSIDTNRGVVDGLLDFGFLDNSNQAMVYTESYFVESSTTIVKKLWMNSKFENSRSQIGNSVLRVVGEVERFRPDLIMLGDDNATNYIGNQLLDSDIAVVFWGVNGQPLKYGLIDTIEKPGRNITGVYQAGYLLEGVNLLKQLLPEISNIAVMSDFSPTGRSKAKLLVKMHKLGLLPVDLTGVVTTDSASEWKRKALELKNVTDAFVILNHNTLKDDNGKPVGQMEIGSWYLQNIQKPEVSHERQFVVEGILCAIDDSGYKQGYEATRMAHQILHERKRPADISVIAPPPGDAIVNIERARMPGLEKIVLGSKLFDERIQSARALNHSFN